MIHRWIKFSFLAPPREDLCQERAPGIWLGLVMALFYFARWTQNQSPASQKGLIFPADDFYVYSACLSPFLWPALTRLTARLMTKLSGGTARDTILFSHAYATPLLVWLGGFEFLVWVLLPPELFGRIALCLMVCAMSVVYIQSTRVFNPARHSALSRHFRTTLSLVPQLLVATLIFR